MADKKRVDYDKIYDAYIREHESQVTVSNCLRFQQNPLRNESQTHFKEYERLPSGKVLVRHGVRLGDPQPEEEDLAVFCIGILQCQATFPIRIFTRVKRERDSIIAAKSECQIWAQGSLAVNQIKLTEKQLQFQNKLHRFYCRELAQRWQSFSRVYINWDYMCSKEYTDIGVAELLRSQVIEPLNRQFTLAFGS